MGEVNQACHLMEIKSISLGDMMDEGLIGSKVDYIRMITRFQEDEAFMLVDNDPNEIVSALKNHLMAMLVPPDLTEDLFGDDVADLIEKVKV